MPNWNEGTLRMRGKRDDIIKFLTEGVNSYTRRITDEGEFTYLPIDKKDLYTFDGDYIEYNDSMGSGIYVEGTARGFICSSSTVVYIPNHTSVLARPGIDSDDMVYTYVDYKQAWAIDPDELAAISAKYHIDFRIFAAEAGMGFWIDLEILDGKITKNENSGSISYYEYVWSCPIPNAGG